jgi:hypothetical protein
MSDSSDLKFTCPSCGQHIQCDDDCAGENVPCPNCAKTIRVPGKQKSPVLRALAAKRQVEKESNPFQTASSEKVSYTSSAVPEASTAENQTRKPEAPAEKPEEIPVATASQPASPPPPQPEPDAHAVDIHCVCPMCHSELRIAGSNSGKLPTVEVVRAGRPSPEPAHATHKPHPPGTKHDDAGLKEREKQIAEARGHQEISRYPAMKPRLDYVLSGGEAPKQPPSNLADETKPPPDDTHSLSE